MNILGLFIYVIYIKIGFFFKYVRINVNKYWFFNDRGVFLIRVLKIVFLKFS